MTSSSFSLCSSMRKSSHEFIQCASPLWLHSNASINSQRQCILQQCRRFYHRGVTPKPSSNHYRHHTIPFNRFVPSSVSYNGSIAGQPHGCSLLEHHQDVHVKSVTSGYFNRHACRWNSSLPSTQAEKDEAPPPPPAPEFPPNVTAEFSNEPPQSEPTSSTRETVKPDPFTTRPPPFRSLRQATRFAISALPGQAHVVMQQQHLITRLITARFRAWQGFKGRKQPVDLKAAASSAQAQGLGRRSSKRRKARASRKVGAKKDKKASSAVSSAPVEKVAPKTEKEKPPQQHLEEHSFLKDTSIEENLPSLTPPPPPEEPSPVPKQFLADKLPKDLQPSLEVSLGAEAPPKSLETSEIDSSIAGAADGGATLSAGKVEEERELDRSELLRNYEAVLQVVLAAGVIEADAKRFLDEYRKRCSIKVTQHIEALKRLGWSEEEYSQGFSSSSSRKISRWRRLLNRLLDILEVQGNYVVTIGSLASLTSIMMASMAHLRMLQLVSGTLYFTYNITRRPALVSAAYWNLVFFAINSFMLLRLFFETRPETFSENELDVFERYFLHTGLSPRQFKRLLTAATWRHVPRGEVLVRQGEEVKELMIVHQGTLSVLLNGSEVEVLEGGDKNAIIGLKTFLTRLDEVRVAQGKSVPAATSSASVERASQPSTSDSSSAPREGPTDRRQPAVTTPSSGIAESEPESASTSEGESNIKDVQQPVHSHGVYPSHTSVVVARDAFLLVWPMEALVKRVNADPSVALPLVGGFARSLVARSRNQSLKQSLTSYEAAIRGVLSDGVAGSEEKRFLRECRQKFNVSEEQHWALVEQLGWTREEFEFGAKGTVPSIRGILMKVRDQIGLSLPGEQQQSTNIAKDNDE